MTACGHAIQTKGTQHRTVHLFGVLHQLAPSVASKVQLGTSVLQCYAFGERGGALQSGDEVDGTREVMKGCHDQASTATPM